MNFPKIFLQSTPSSSIEEEQLYTEVNGKRKITKMINTRNKKKRKVENISKSFTENNIEEMAWIDEICL